MMTDLEMTHHLLNKHGRIYDELINEDKSVVIQIHMNDFRLQVEFDASGELTAEWENPYESQWISEQWRYD